MLCIVITAVISNNEKLCVRDSEHGGMGRNKRGEEGMKAKKEADRRRKSVCEREKKQRTHEMEGKERREII